MAVTLCRRRRNPAGGDTLVFATILFPDLQGVDRAVNFDRRLDEFGLIAASPPPLAAARAMLADRILGTSRPRLFLVLLCLAMWIPGFFTIPPVDRDESRFAQAAKQMLESGDYVDIRNGTEARNNKPIGIYWLQVPFAAAARAAGLARENPIWPYRLPSLLGGIAAVLLTWGFGRRLVGERAALLGAAMLASSVILAVETHQAKTDAALLAATTLAMGVLTQARLAPASVTRGRAAWFWVAMAAGILIKGPITPMVVGLTSLSLALWDRKRPRWLLALRPAWGAPLMLALVLPWFVAIGVATHGRFFAQSLGGDLGSKMSGGMESHGAPPGFHLLLLPLLCFPFVMPAARAVPAAWRNRALPEIRVLIAWIVPSWIVFELVPTKLPHYTLPLYPAVALLAAYFVVTATWIPRWARRMACAEAVICAVVIGAAAAALPIVADRAMAGWALGLPGLAAAAILLLLMLRRHPLVPVLCAPLLYWAILGAELPDVSGLWLAPRLVAAMGPQAADRFASVGFHEPSLMFLEGTGTEWADAANAADFLAEPGPRTVAVSDRDVAVFSADTRRRGIVVRPFGAVSGFDYSRGRQMRMVLFRKN